MRWREKTLAFVWILFLCQVDFILVRGQNGREDPTTKRHISVDSVRWNTYIERWSMYWELYSLSEEGDRNNINFIQILYFILETFQKQINTKKLTVVLFMLAFTFCFVSFFSFLHVVYFIFFYILLFKVCIH